MASYGSPRPTVRCMAEYSGFTTRVYRCMIRVPEGQKHPGSHRRGDLYWPDTVATYPTLPDAQVNREVARRVQVSGDHYKKFKIQPWDIWQEYQLDAFTGTVIKYLLRAGHKDSKLEDLKKARHTLDALIEIEEAKGNE